MAWQVFLQVLGSYLAIPGLSNRDYHSQSELARSLERELDALQRNIRQVPIVGAYVQFSEPRFDKAIQPLARGIRVLGPPAVGYHACHISLLGSVSDDLLEARAHQSRLSARKANELASASGGLINDLLYLIDC